MARTAENEAEELLVDEGWKSDEIDLEDSEAYADGHGDNGHRDPFAVEPEVEIVLANGHASENGNGRRDETGEPQPSLFSWAEFMAEPVKPKRRSRNPQPASLSMFEWAMEQEREMETVGA